MLRPPSELYVEITDLLFTEASLLDEGRLDEWLLLLSDDIRYVMPVRRDVQPSKSGPEEADETFSIYNEDKASLATRVQRIGTGSAHAEVPRSVTQRLITNVRVEAGATNDNMVVHSNFLVYQERRGRHSVTFIGKRRDRLRREDGTLKIAERRIDLAQHILPSTISIMF